MDSPPDELLQSHLDWTSKQGRILTANGRANDYYTEARGFPFFEEELPHHYLLVGDTSFSNLLNRETPSPIVGETRSPIIGAWSRDYFVGGWEFSSNQTETVYNVQTNSLFIDLRIPKTRNQILGRDKTSLEEYTNLELRAYARQHVFAGMSLVENSEEQRPVCTRHHVLDWNFVGVPRPRPNKWWIECNPCSRDIWKEWAFASDDYQQHYYCEQWSRLPPHGKDKVTLALRKEQTNDKEDGILVVVGNNFNYIRGRALAFSSKPKYKNATSLVELVDAALQVGDRETAIAWLGRIQAGHGRIIDKQDHTWKIDCAIEPWKEGSLLFQEGHVVVVVDEGQDNDVKDCHVIWNGERWNVFDTSLKDVQQVRDLFEKGLLP